MALIFVGCGDVAGTGSARKNAYFTEASINSILERQEISCPEGPCREGIGRLFKVNAQDPDKSSLCTAFLIASDLALTNSHCIEPRKRSDVSCKSLHFAFPQENGPVLSAKCRDITWKDPSGFAGNDFALVRLDRHLNLTPLPINPRSVDPKTDLHPVVIDHIDLYRARVVNLTCKSSGKHARGYFQLDDCPIIRGNSGSPVLDRDGSVVGLIFASNDPAIAGSTTPLALRKGARTQAFAFGMDHVEALIQDQL